MIKIEWEHDFMDGSFHGFQSFDSWDEALARVKELSLANGYEVFAIEIED